MVCWKKLSVVCILDILLCFIFARGSSNPCGDWNRHLDGKTMGKPWWNHEDVSNPLTNGMVIPTFFSRDWRCLEFQGVGSQFLFAIKGSFRCLFEKIASILGTIMDLGIWGWIRVGMGYIWRIHQSQWDVVYKWLTIPLPQLWQE